MIRFTDITKTYQTGAAAFKALAGVSVTINEGEFTAIMGPSGSGKSTMLHIMGFLDRPDGGSYELMGRETAGLTSDEYAKIRRETIGFVFQQFHLLPRLTTFENVELPLLYTGRPDEESARGKELLELVGLGTKLVNMPNELSGGERQRVAIARSLINDPAVIMADEPTGNLDSKSQTEIMEIFARLNKLGKTIIVVTHDDEVAAYTHRIIRIRDGRIVSDNATAHGAAKTVSAGTLPSGESAPVRQKELFMFIRQALGTILGNKLRSFLSMLGILIGVMAVIAMLALGEGAKASIQKSLASLGSNLLQIMPGASRQGGVMLATGSVTRLTLKDAEDLAKLPGVKNAAPNVTGRAQLVYAGQNWNTQVQGTGIAFPELRSASVAYGRFFSESELRSRQLVAAIGPTVARQLFGGDDPVGKTLKVNKKNFKIIGVFTPRGSSGFRDNDDIVVVPVSTAMNRLLGKIYVDSIDVQIEDMSKTNEMFAAIKSTIMKRHGITSEANAGFQILNMAEIQRTLQSTTQAMTMLLGFIAAISLVVGGIGIMNIMLVSVTERTREIGLRKAIGATEGDILMQFIVESSLMTFIGGTAGMLLGIGTALLVTAIVRWTTLITPVSVIISLFFSVGIGFVFGILPARKAAELNPIDALRYE